MPHLLLLAGLSLLGIRTLAADDFRPGAVWKDTAGRPINAHGGGLLWHDGTYYWYGEIKSGLTWLPKVNKSWGGTRVIAGGVSVYASKDLVNWTDVGVALPVRPREPDHDLSPENVIERPKVIYNARTRRFVMWFHQDSPNYAAARAGVAVSETPTGPFHYLGSFRPNAGIHPLNATEAELAPGSGNLLARDLAGGQMARDMTLFVDDDGTAYHLYASESNQTLHVSKLSDDYLRPSGQYVRIFVGESVEAPAVFKHDGRYYLIGSGCTGWDPNPARAAVADSIFGPWVALENPCRGPEAEITFRSQITHVVPVAGRAGQFIALFDRWNKWDLADSRYVWLPVQFDAEKRPVIAWAERWTLP